ncbi:hypothetical protein Tco_0469024 [Tanacetum coccineum]
MHHASWKIHDKELTGHDLELGVVVFALKDLEILICMERKCTSVHTITRASTRYHPGKANVVVDALSRKEREPPLRVRALVMTISLDLPKQILKLLKQSGNQKH